MHKKLFFSWRKMFCSVFKFVAKKKRIKLYACYASRHKKTRVTY